MWVLAQLVGASYRYREVTGSNPVEVSLLLYAIAKIASITARIIALLKIVIIIQHIVTMPKCGHSALNFHRAYSTDILRYT